jgi:hypothetical protein
MTDKDRAFFKALKCYEIVYIVVSEYFPLLEIKTNINITGNVDTISFD